MAQHNKLLLATMIIAALILVFNFALSAINNFETNLYRYNLSELSNKYFTGITPSGWTFSIWGLIYFWQCLWIIFAFINIFRKVDGNPAYVSPMVLTPALFIAYAIDIAFTITWTFVFDRELIEISFVTLFLVSFTLYICLFIAYKNYATHAPILAKQGRNIELWLHRLFVHNGLGIFATWTTIATLLNLVMMLVYRLGVELQTGGTIALGILTGEITLFVFTDLFFLDKFSRYTLTPYLVVPFALGGSMDKNWNSDKTNSIFTAALLGIGLAALVLKLIMMFWRHCRKPIQPGETNSYDLKV
ncbi:hypothetical protein LOTGIDRAFT_210838 [Lottia gigantea]|uniref:Uncharacterized protein n=1 Tax=Lottia gigantea TaxID=225164 RepID=V4B9K1_LOTGI|nr:hypothetical protein LOTGIDRAFT_210838 [Lottia gigantea]ESO85629.1 hypothetical protein LOTGIDRAFT_210838 [Lottia gigantea]